jgi:tetratricopeptide (TPR) repeat protein
MTSNHLLLYRLAELMLQNEQHILQVDLLFEDNQIGDFVKSIQIDSPYQQMLLEGVLTESVHDEKLFVSFTVEGYFHFVLGEVIYNRTEGFGAEVLKQIVEENKLNGLKEGVEQCLIRYVEKDDLSRLMWLIDQGGKSLVVCSIPLALAFIQVKGKPKTDEEVHLAQRAQIKSVMDTLLLGSSNNYINALEKALSYLKEKQKKKVVSTVYQQINISIQPKNLKNASLFLSSLRYVSKSDLPSKIRMLENFQFENNNSASYALYLGRLAGIYLIEKIKDYKKAIFLFSQALEININQNPQSYRIVSSNFNELGLAYMLIEDFDNSIENYKRSLIIQLENHREDLSSILECLGLVEFKRNNFKIALDWFDKTVKIKELNLGYYHTSVGSTLSAIALTYTKAGDSLNAIKYWQKTLEIELNVNKHEKQIIAILNKKIGDEYFKIMNCDLAISHLLVFWNYLKSINKINTVFTDLTDKILKCHNSIGLEKYKSCEYSESINIFNSALKLISESKTSKSKMIHVIYFNLGNAYFKHGQLKQAKFYLDHALKIRIKSIEKNSTLVGRTYNSLGNVELSEGNDKKAKELYQKAHSIFLDVLGEDHPNTKLLTNKIHDIYDL